MGAKPVGLPPPPGIDNIQPSTKDKVLGGIGGFMSAGTGLDFKQTPLGQKLQQHHDAQFSQAEMYWKLAQTAGGEIATKKDSATGRDLTPEEIESRQHQYQAAMDAYGKIVGVNKETKAAHGKARMVLDHLLGRGQGQPQPGAQGQVPPAGAGNPGGGPPAPPTASAGAGAGAGTGAAPAAATKGMPAPPNRMSPEQMAGVYPSEQVQNATEDRRKIDVFRQQSDIQKQARIEEEKAKPSKLSPKTLQGPNNEPMATNYDAATGKYYDSEGKEITDPKPYVKAAAKRQGWGVDDKGYYSFLRDPATNKPIEGTKDYTAVPPAYMLPQIHSGYHYWTDDDGNLHQTAQTTTSSHGIPSPPSKRGAGGAGAATKSGDTVLGPAKRPPEATAAIKAADSSERAYNAAMKVSQHPTPVSDKGLFMDWAKTHIAGAGRLNTVELKMAMQSGNYDARLKRWASLNMGTGLMDDETRNQLLGDMRDQAEAAMQEAAKYRKSASGGGKGNADDILRKHGVIP
jgi:hypothetical protein